jgi:phospholipid transport system substrate-binding protein
MKHFIVGAALMAGLSIIVPSPALVQAATAAQQAEAAAFVEGLAAKAFGVLKDKSLSREAGRARFRELLRENFAIEQVGMKIIRKHRAGLTPKQLEAYKAALPDFIVNSYSGRLYDFADSKVTVVRQVPRGTRGDVDVYSRVTDPKGGKPIDAIWSVSRASGRWLVTNLTVNGVNVALTQEADFDAYIQKNGFDALVDFMKTVK